MGSSFGYYPFFMKFTDFTREQQKSIDNLRRVFNRKRTMIIRRNPAMEQYLPPKLTRATFEKEVESPGDFDLTYRVYHSFLKKGSENVIDTETRIITQWDVNRANTYVKAINESRKQVFEDLTGAKYAQLLAQYHMLNDRDVKEMTFEEISDLLLKQARGPHEQLYNGEYTGLLPKSMQTPAIIAANYDATMTKLIQQSRATYYQNRINQYKTNYLQAIKNSYGFFNQNGEFSGMSEQAWEFYEYISKMDARTLLAASYTNEKLKLKFNYEPDENNSIIQEITENWFEYFYGDDKARAVETYSELVNKNVNDLEFKVDQYLFPKRSNE